jgi:hypothetical protein
MNRDETSLHPDTDVTSDMFVERSLNGDASLSDAAKA